jgi:hypothetical protein
MAMKWNLTWGSALTAATASTSPMKNGQLGPKLVELCEFDNVGLTDSGFV